MRNSLMMTAILLSGCAPNIEQFAASPNQICPGDPVTLAWRVSGADGDRATLITAPDGPSPSSQSVAAVDSVAVSPMESTLFRLTATNGNGTSRKDAGVSRMGPGDPALSLGFSQTLLCQGSRIDDHVVFGPPAGSVSPRLRVVRLDPILDATTTAALLTGPQPGQPVTGPWVLSWSYVGPACPPLADTSKPVPTGPTPVVQVGLRVTLECV